MAFMMPVVKKDWEIYPNKPVRSRKSSTNVPPRNKSSSDMFAAGSPTSNEFVPPSVIAYRRSESNEESGDNNHVPTIPKSASTSSFSNFHARLVERIRKISRGSKNCDTEVETVAETGRTSS
jgi:hypothetical protein